MYMYEKNYNLQANNLHTKSQLTLLHSERPKLNEFWPFQVQSG